VTSPRVTVVSPVLRKKFPRRARPVGVYPADLVAWATGLPVRDTLVFMSQHVADGGNFRAWNFRETGFQLVPRSRLASEMISIPRWTSQRLRLSGPKASIVTRHSRHFAADQLDRLDNVGESPNRRRWCHQNTCRVEASIRSRTVTVSWVNDNIVRAAARYVYGRTASQLSFIENRPCLPGSLGRLFHRIDWTAFHCENQDFRHENKCLKRSAFSVQNLRS
jgi:hypothetical protein